MQIDYSIKIIWVTLHFDRMLSLLSAMQCDQFTDWVDDSYRKMIHSKLVFFDLWLLQNCFDKGWLRESALIFQWLLEVTLLNWTAWNLCRITFAASTITIRKIPIILNDKFCLLFPHFESIRRRRKKKCSIQF